MRIEVVHPDARLVDLEEQLVQRFGLEAAVVVDVPAATVGRRAADDLARDAVAEAAVGLPGRPPPDGGDRRLMGPDDARPRAPSPGAGWTDATEIVQINGATSRSALADPRQRDRERFGNIVRSVDSAPGGARDRRQPRAEDGARGRSRHRRDDRGRPRTPTADLRPRHPGGGQRPGRFGYVTPTSRRASGRGAVGDIIGRFVERGGPHRVARCWTSGPSACPSTTSGQAAVGRPGRGAGRGPIALAAIRGRLYQRPGGGRHDRRLGARSWMSC